MSRIARDFTAIGRSVPGLGAPSFRDNTVSRNEIKTHTHTNKRPGRGADLLGSGPGQGRLGQVHSASAGSMSAPLRQATQAASPSHLYGGLHVPRCTLGSVVSSAAPRIFFSLTWQKGGAEGMLASSQDSEEEEKSGR